MVRSKAQLLLEQLDGHLSPQDEWTPVAGAAIGASIVAHEVTKHRTRSKYGLGDHIENHFQRMEKIRQKDIPKIDKRAEYKALTQKTKGDMAQKVHDLRTKHGLNTSPNKEKRIVNRAFHGTLTGAPAIMFRNTPNL